jgi:hypothetical protein
MMSMEIRERNMDRLKSRLLDQGRVTVVEIKAEARAGKQKTTKEEAY